MPFLLPQPLLADVSVEPFRVQLPNHLPPLVRGLVVNVYLAARRLLGLLIGPLRRVVAQPPVRVLAFIPWWVLRLLVTVLPLPLPHVPPFALRE